LISVSGYRFRLEELSLEEVEEFVSKFVGFTKADRVAVGMDTRDGSGVLKDYVEAILLSLKVDVVDFGVIPTPALFREVRTGFKAGLMITASHNPPEWVGIKPIYMGRGLFEEELGDMLKLKGAVEGGWGKLSHSASRYREEVVEFLGVKGLDLRIGIDPGGGAGAGFVEGLFESVGARVISVNSSKGVASRGPDPVSDGLEGLRALVGSEGLDVGFAFDLDADRLVVVDEKGRKLDGDETLMLCLLYMLEKGSKSIAVSVDTSSGVEELAGLYGAKVYRSKVGEANVVKCILEHGCDAGGEGSSGGFIPARFNYCRDGILASMLIAKMIEERGSLSGLVEALPRYRRVRVKARLPREKGERAIDRLFEKYGGDRTDGLKLRFGGSWVLVRCSNTEDVVRVSAEARDEEEAKGLASRFLKEVMGLAE